MSSEVFDFFPLTIFKDKIIISQKEKNEIINFIFNSEKEGKKLQKRKGDAWLGDTRGQEYLFKVPIMKILSNLISDKIKLYTEMLRLNNEKLYFYYQRTWATITKNKEQIRP